MAGPGGGGGGDGKDNTYFILWVFALIAAVCFVIWYFFSEQLIIAFIYLRLAELWVMDSFVSLFLPLNIPWITNAEAELGASLDITKQLTVSSISGDVAFNISEVAGSYLRFPAGILLAFLGYFTFKYHMHMRFIKKYNMKTLAEQECVNWPQIKIATKNDIHSQDLDSGPWAMCQTPLQYAKNNKLVALTKAEKVGTGFSKTQTAEYKLILDKAKAERAFSAQLGRPWRGVENLASHRKAIFTVLAARGCRNGKDALSMVYQLADSAADGKINYKGVDELLNKYVKDKAITKICNQHAYEFTVFASMLLFAREDGVLASADFLWVKPLDRRLWYVLNNVGRQTPAAEVGGIFSHWYTELALKRPLSVPFVTIGVDALELALADVFYVPTDAEKEEFAKQEKERAEAEAQAKSTEMV